MGGVLAGPWFECVVWWECLYSLLSSPFSLSPRLCLLPLIYHFHLPLISSTLSFSLSLGLNLHFSAISSTLDIRVDYGRACISNKQTAHVVFITAWIDDKFIRSHKFIVIYRIVSFYICHHPVHIEFGPFLPPLLLIKIRTDSLSLFVVRIEHLIVAA